MCPPSDPASHGPSRHQVVRCKPGKLGGSGASHCRSGKDSNGAQSCSCQKSNSLTLERAHGSRPGSCQKVPRGPRLRASAGRRRVLRLLRSPSSVIPPVGCHCNRGSSCSVPPVGFPTPPRVRGPSRKVVVLRRSCLRKTVSLQSSRKSQSLRISCAWSRSSWKTESAFRRVIRPWSTMGHLLLCHEKVLPLTICHPGLRIVK